MKGISRSTWRVIKSSEVWTHNETEQLLPWYKTHFKCTSGRGVKRGQRKSPDKSFQFVGLIFFHCSFGFTLSMTKMKRSRTDKNGRRQGTPWTSLQFIARLIQRDKRLNLSPDARVGRWEEGEGGNSRGEHAKFHKGPGREWNLEASSREATRLSI